MRSNKIESYGESATLKWIFMARKMQTTDSAALDQVTRAGLGF